MRPKLPAPLRWLPVLVLLAIPAPLPAQDAPAPPPARPQDVQSIDAIIGALYDAISGGVDEPRDWDRLRSLFVPGAHLIPTGPAPEGGHRHRVLSVEDYIRDIGPRLQAIGFRERELGRVTERYGNIAHAFSSYESYRGSETTPFARGINSIQLLDDGRRWWVVNVFWEAERPDNLIPERYLIGNR